MRACVRARKFECMCTALYIIRLVLECKIKTEQNSKSALSRGSKCEELKEAKKTSVRGL